jgi:hypothetical protein
MNDLDKEAFEKWFISNRDSSFAVFLRENYPDVGIKWDREPARSAWQAACEFKQKEIDAVMSENKLCERFITQIQADKFEMRGDIQKLQAENDSLKDGSYWQSDIERLEAENAKLRSITMLASEASCYTEYEDACSVARQCLRELNEEL